VEADVKGGSGPGRAARTEARVIAAATALFPIRGYRGTALTDVAERAGVAPRTVYVRFGTKAELLKRVMDVAIAGDALPIDVAHRDWTVTALTAPTLAERLHAHAAGSRAIMERIAPLMAVVAEAVPLEPAIAAAAAAGREDTLRQLRRLWVTLHTDGLMHPDTDLDWVITTSGLLGTVDTYLVLTRTLGWDPDDYQTWRYRTWTQLATTPGPPELDAPQS
jgi:AcrR family transcriptional regulator